jgi:WD40 repeat protein
MSIVKSLEKSELLRLRAFRLLELILLSTLIFGCHPSSSTSTVTQSPSSTSTPVAHPTSTLQLQISPTPQAFPSTHTNPAIKFNSWEIIHDIAYSPDGSVLAISAGSHIRIYNGETLEEMAEVQVGAWINRIAFHSNLPLIILAAKDGTIQFRGTLSGELVCQFKAHEKGANSLGVDPKGTLLITTGTDITSRLWDISSVDDGECRIDEIGTFIGESRSSPDAVFSPDGTSIALVDLSNIRLRKTTDRKLISLLESEGPIFDIAFSPDGHWLAAAQHLDSVTLWDMTHAGHPVATTLQAPSPDFKTFTWRVAFSPDSTMLAAGASDGSITIWDLPALKPIEAFHLPRAVSALAFSPDGTHLSAGGLDSAVWLFPINEE